MKANEIIQNQDLMNELINLMRKANNAIIQIYKKPFNNIELKDNNTPLTEADLAANKILTENLDNIFPNIPIVSEEDKDSLSIPKHHNVFWLIDPLDGTKEFINKNGEFTCNLALIENNYTQLGFVGIPVKELIYFGGKNVPSNRINKKNILQEIKYSSKKGICRVVASKSHLNKETKTFIENIPGPTEIIQAGSSLKFLTIAEGLADIYPRLGPTSEWDTAAAHAVLEGAGGQVLKLNGKDLVYGKEDILNPYFVAKGITDKSNS